MEETPTPSISHRSELAQFCRWFFSWHGFRRVLILGAWLATILALVYAEENWRGRRAWNRYRQELEARGEQLDFRSFIPKPIPDEQNLAATACVESWFTHRGDHFKGDLYEQVEAKISSPGIKEGQRHRRFVDLVARQQAREAMESGKLKRGDSFQSDKLDAESRAKAAPGILEALKESDANITELRAASSRPAARYPVVYDLENPWGILLPHLANLKAACSRLKLKACAELALGQTQNALDDTKLILYLADSVKDEPFLISYLVRAACLQIATQPLWEGLAEHRWSEPQLQELQARFQGYNWVADMFRPLGGEQAAGILTVDLIKKRGRSLLVDLGSEGPPADRKLAQFWGFFIPSGWYDQERLNYCRLYQAQLAAIFDGTKKRISPTQIAVESDELARVVAGGGLGKELSGILHHHQIASLLLPALGKVPLKAAGVQAVSDEAALACALERYRLAHGQFPEKLEALVPSLIARLPHDPLTAEPYKYRHSSAEDSFVLYSVGWNERDDGGVPGRSLFDEKDGDWVWESAPGKMP